MIRITCPICSGPLDLGDGQEDVARALQAALRALEDQAAGARWRLSQPDPPPLLQAQLDQSRHHIELLHSLLRDRPD